MTCKDQRGALSLGSPKLIMKTDPLTLDPGRPAHFLSTPEGATYDLEGRTRPSLPEGFYNKATDARWWVGRVSQCRLPYYFIV